MAEKTKKKKLSANKSKTLILLSMALPGAIWFLLLRYLPMAGVILAFKDYKVYTKAPSFWNNMVHSKWVGLDNFKFLFSTPDSWRYVKNTIGYNVLWILLGLVVSVAFAIILNEITQKFVAKAYQTMMFFPYFLSWVVASYFVLAFLDPTRGLLTHWMSAHGMTPIQWYSEPKYWPYILTICNIWKNTGYSTILYLAAITGIDASQYEAASIDGATKWQQIRFITLPLLKSTMIMLIIMSVGRMFYSDFGLFYQIPMNSGALYSTTQTIDTYVYRALMQQNDVGMASAAGFYQSIVGFILVLTANMIVRKVSPDDAMF